MHKPLIFAALMATLGLQTQALAEDTSGPDIHGRIEVTMSPTAINLAKAELLFSQQINELVNTNVSILYEGSTTDVDVATISIAPKQSPWSLITGQYYLPFGRFDTDMISDPLTMELGKTRPHALQFGYEAYGFALSAYVVSGASSLDTNGYNLSYDYEGSGVNFALAVGATNDLSKAVNIDSTDQVAALSLFVTLGLGDFSLSYENIAAGSAFTTGTLNGQMPSATNIEMGYGFTLGGKESVLAIAAQTSTGANGLLDQSRNMLVLSSMIMPETSLGLEYSQSLDYSAAVTEAITLKLAAEF